MLLGVVCGCFLKPPISNLLFFPLKIDTERFQVRVRSVPPLERGKSCLEHAHLLAEAWVAAAGRNKNENSGRRIKGRRQARELEWISWDPACKLLQWTHLLPYSCGCISGNRPLSARKSVFFNCPLAPPLDCFATETST